MTKINKNWRKQRKAVLYKEDGTGKVLEYISLWQAGNVVSGLVNCQPDTARKEIRKSIKLGRSRYGGKWSWKI